MDVVRGTNMGDMLVQIIFFIIIIAIIVVVISMIVVKFKSNKQLSRIEEKLDKLLQEKKDDDS